MTYGVRGRFTQLPQLRREPEQIESRLFVHKKSVGVRHISGLLIPQVWKHHSYGNTTVTVTPDFGDGTHFRNRGTTVNA